MENIILEPVMRNTAPCILLSTLYIKNIYKDANIVVLPSDHLIKDEKEFQDVIMVANNKIEEIKDGIITIGIVPNRPETGYGYIEVATSGNINSRTVLEVEKFVEKPNLEKALEYIASSKYLWNAGMFIFNSNYLLEQFKKHLEEMYIQLKDLPNNYKDISKFLEERYPLCQKISFDYGIMEKSSDIYVIPSDFGWDDVGTWSSVERYIDRSECNNVLKGDVYIDNSNNNIVYGGIRKIILSNVDDLYCIDSDDVLIIGRRDDINEVHKYRDKVDV